MLQAMLGVSFSSVFSTDLSGEYVLADSINNVGTSFAGSTGKLPGPAEDKWLGAPLRSVQRLLSTAACFQALHHGINKRYSSRKSCMAMHA